jgi:hypothetical protein
MVKHTICEYAEGALIRSHAYDYARVMPAYGPVILVG